MKGTEVWFRNPSNYIRELAEVGLGRIAWDRGLCIKRNIDPLKHASVYFANREWKLLMIGDQGSAEYNNESNGDPVGVYPTWDAVVDDLALLEEMMAYPIGEDESACNDKSLPVDQRPILGQRHRVVVINIPPANKTQGRALVRNLKELQEDYPECDLYIHGLYSWRISFGMGFGSTDVDPRTNAGKGKVTLPSGKEMIAENTVNVPQWVNILGMKPVDLTREPRNRCIFNIKSALWASDNYMENVAFASKVDAGFLRQRKGDVPIGSQMGSRTPPDTTSKTARPIETKSKSPFTKPLVAQPNDKINCDTCSLQNNCKFYRQGSVCSVPGSEPAELAKHFNTRDADQIIDGLGTILALQARRLDRGVSDENLYGELDPEVTKIANQLFTNGSKLAKLVDPTRFAAPGVQVNVGSNGANVAAIKAATPNQVLGSIVRELEVRGINRDQITPDMVGNLLAEMGGASNAPEAIEGRVVSNEQ